MLRIDVCVTSVHAHVNCLTSLTLTLTINFIVDMNFLDKFNRGSQRDWSEDGFLCLAPFMRLIGCPVAATQEGYWRSVA